MKKVYTTLLILLSIVTMQAQTFEFSISYVGLNPNTNNHQMAFIATPSSSVTNGNTADMGGGFYVPSGLTIGNFVGGNSGLPASEWSSIPMDSNENGDAYFIARIEAAAFSIYLNGSDPFELVLFDIIADPNPTTGQIIYVENGDPVFDVIFIENYININLGAGTINAYSQNNPTANSVNFATLTTQEFNDNLTIAIYPNPASEVLNITTDLQITKLELFDILGKRVLQTGATKQLKIDQFKAGVYFIKVHTASGMMTKKLIIE